MEYNGMLKLRNIHWIRIKQFKAETSNKGEVMWKHASLNNTYDNWH